MITSIAKDVEKFELSYIACGNDPAINSISRYLLKRNENIYPHKNIYTNVYSIIVHNSYSGNNTDVHQLMSDNKNVV